MRRRHLLAALGATLGAGCLDRSDPEDALPRTSSAPPTVPEHVTVYTETKAPPTPPGTVTAGAARSFVATHEQRYVYNDLVGDASGVSAAGYDAPTSVDVEPATVRVFRESPDGYYLLSACSGSADYYCADSCSRSRTRNAHDVLHFVGPERHERVPFNAYSCEEPGPVAEAEQSDDGDGGAPDGTDDGPVARFQIYDLHSEMDYEHPEQGGREVDVRVADADGTTVLDRTYRTSLPLTVQTDVVADPGVYEVTATLDDGMHLEREWDLADPGTPAWWALSLFVAPDGGLFAEVVAPGDDLGPPRDGVCRGVGTD